jgi:hypothetical protein
LLLITPYRLVAIVTASLLYIGRYIAGLVLAVLGWRYWAGGLGGGVPGRVGTVTRGRVEVVTAGSNC